VKIGILSDIHNNKANLLKAINLLNNKKVGQVFFCGDLTLAKTIDNFKALKAPVKAVFGNVDRQDQILTRIKQLKIDFNYPKKNHDIYNLTIDNKKIAMVHGHDNKILRNILNNRYDFVFSGHSHQPEIKKINQTIWINPGSICGYMDLDKKLTKPSLAVLDLKTSKSHIFYL